MDRRVLLPSKDALLPILSGAYFVRVQDSLPPVCHFSLLCLCTGDTL
jgi:hypothetical protein